MEDGELYWRGWQNKLIRGYFYVQNGLNVVNQFRYLILGIFSIWALAKLKVIWFSSAWWMAVMFVVCMPILGYLGRYNLKKISPVIDWLNVFVGSHFGIKNFDNVKETKDNSTRMVELLEQLLKKP